MRNNFKTSKLVHCLLSNKEANVIGENTVAVFYYVNFILAYKNTQEGEAQSGSKTARYYHSWVRKDGKWTINGGMEAA